jgi:small subunit ribosomal protein S17
MSDGSKRSPRRTLTGVVVSDRMAKTVSVRVRNKTKHPKYGKYVVRTTVHKAHDERGTAKQGDTVEIAFARRLSKTKHWRLVRVVEKARVVAVTGAEEVAAAVAPAAAPAPKGAEEASS